MDSKQKRKIFFLVGTIWLLTIILIALSVVAWYTKAPTGLLLILLFADFLVLSAAGTTLTVPFLLHKHKRRAQKETDKD